MGLYLILCATEILSYIVKFALDAAQAFHDVNIRLGILILTCIIVFGREGFKVLIHASAVSIE